MKCFMLPRLMSRGTLGCIEGTRDEVLYAAAHNDIVSIHFSVRSLEKCLLFLCPVSSKPAELERRQRIVTTLILVEAGASRNFGKTKVMTSRSSNAVSQEADPGAP